MDFLRFLYQFRKIKENHSLNDFWHVQVIPNDRSPGIYHLSFKLPNPYFTVIMQTLLIYFGKWKHQVIIQIELQS